MNNILSKKSLRLLSVLLAVLILTNIVPSGMTQLLHAQAQSQTSLPSADPDPETLAKYSVALVDEYNEPLPVSGVEVKMVVTGEETDPDYGTAFQQITENGEAVFENTIIPDRKYNIIFNAENSDTCSFVDTVENLSVEKSAGDDQNITVTVKEEQLKTIACTIKVKNETDFREYEKYQMRAEYWTVINHVDGEKQIVKKWRYNDDRTELSFRIEGKIGRRYGFQLSGTPFAAVGPVNVDLTESDIVKELESGLALKTCTVTFDKASFENAFVVDLSDEGLYGSVPDEDLANSIYSRDDDAIDVETYSQTFVYGASPRYMIVADDGYRISGCTVNNKDPENGDTANEIPVAQENKYLLKLNNITQTASISAKVEKKTYSVRFVVDSKGSVQLKGSSEELDSLGGSIEIKNENDDDSAERSVSVNEATKLTVKAAAAESYHVTHFTYKEIDENTGENIGSVQNVLEKTDYPQNEPKECTEELNGSDEKGIHSSYEVSIRFGSDQYYVTTESERGKLSVVGAEADVDSDGNRFYKATVGNSVTCQVRPDDGCHIDRIAVKKESASDPDYIDLQSEKLVDNGDGSFEFKVENIHDNTKITVEYRDNDVLPMNKINVTSPYVKNEEFQDYSIYTYRIDDLNKVSVSYTVTGLKETDHTGIRVKASVINEDGEKTDDSFGGYDTTEYKVMSTQLLKSVEIYYQKQWRTVELADSEGNKKNILLVLDNKIPEPLDGGLTKETEIAENEYLTIEGDWTNCETVRVSGSLKPADTESESLLDCAVYSKDKPLDEETIRKAQLTKPFAPIEGYEIGVSEIGEDGAFSFEVKGAQDSSYCVYALDEAGNIYTYEPVRVAIDNAAPTIDSFEIVTTDSEGNLVTLDEFGAAASKKLTVNVTGSDLNSGISSITLYGYDKSGRNLDTFTSKKINPSDSQNYTATFTISGSQYLSLAAAASDNAGNVISEPAQMTSDNSNSYNGDVITGTKDYRVKINPVDVTYQDGDNDWYSEADDIVVNYSAEENWSGFSSLMFDVITYDQSGSPKVHNIKELNASYTNEYDPYSTVYKNGEVNKELTTSVNQTVNVREICEKNNIALNKGRNTVEVTVCSRTQSGSDYISKKGIYDFYVDEDKPAVTKISFSKNQSALQTVINVLSFGLFGSGKLNVDVEINDSDISVSSGYQKIEINGAVHDVKKAKYYTSKDTETTQTVRFVIPLEEISAEDKKIYLNGKLTANVYDNVGHSSGETIPKAADTDPEHSGYIENIMIENADPVISEFDIKPTFTDYNPNTYDNNIWYNEDITFGIKVTDGESGVGTVTAEINGTPINGGELYSSFNSDIPNVSKAEEMFEDTVNVKTNAEGVAMNGNGSYTLSVKAADNAGNTDERALTVYKDTNAPVVTQFEFLTEGSRFGDGAPADGVELTDYGYYFKRDTEVRVHADDINIDGQTVAGSGVNRIYFKAVPVGQSLDDVNTSVLQAAADGTAVFVVPANFKGQLFAYADDNVGNTTGRFVTPSGTVIETSEQHEQEEHIFFSVPQAPAVTGSGNPLYAGAVDAVITIADTYSGIASAEVTINGKSFNVNVDNAKNGDEYINNWYVAGREYNLVTKLTQTITVSDNINNIPISITMTDRSGNTSHSEYSFSIDTTAPSIKIEWDNTPSDSDNKDFFNRPRTAIVTVTERNFAAKNFIPVITNTLGTIPSIAGWTTSGSGDSTTHTATVTFSADGDYEFSASCIDDAGNKSSAATASKCTIDVTKPVVKVTYDNNDAKNGKYYSKNRTAAIEITERNFDSSRVAVTGKADDNGKEIEFPKCSQWKDSDGKHTATIQYTQNANYTFAISVKDKAGNEGGGGASQSFCIDKTAPSIEFSGVADKSANNANIEPVISLSDMNFDEDKVEISLSGANGGSVNYSYNKSANGVNASGGSMGEIIAYDNFKQKKEVDDLYTLSVKLTDLAGNSSESQISFSANRFGSVYTIDDSIKKYLGEYNRKEFDVIFTETNVDTLRDVKMSVIRNQTPNEITNGADYTTETRGGSGSWSQNTYTVKSSVFADNGSYEVRSYSKDKAKNDNENFTEDKDAIIKFWIDKEEPSIISLNFKDSDRFNSNGYEALVEIKDDLSLKDFKIEVDGKTVNATPWDNGDTGENNDTAEDGTDSAEKMTDSAADSDKDFYGNGVYLFNIPQGKDKHNVVITAYDAAGNKSELQVNDIIVTTSALVLWFNNTPLFIGSILVGVALIAGIIIFISALSRRKKA